MRPFFTGILIFCFVLAIPPALLMLYSTWLEVKTDRYYESRPILQALRHAYRTAPVEAGRREAARKELLKAFPLGSDIPSAIAALSAEGFGCQRISPRIPSGDLKKMLERADEIRKERQLPELPPEPVRINCQLHAFADVGYTLWIIDLQIGGSDRLAGASVVSGGISF
jgi:hypothetical protein